jgi:hypothetical protein
MRSGDFRDGVPWPSSEKSCATRTYSSVLPTDFFTSSPFRVDVERDLLVKRQLLLQEKTISAAV